MNKLTEHTKSVQLKGYRERARLPETCPVCDSPPRTYQGGKNDLNRWKHKIYYECYCYLYITEENASGPIVDIPCPKAHGLAVKFKGALGVAYRGKNAEINRASDDAERDAIIAHTITPQTTEGDDAKPKHELCYRCNLSPTWEENRGVTRLCCTHCSESVNVGYGEARKDATRVWNGRQIEKRRLEDNK